MATKFTKKFLKDLKNGPKDTWEREGKGFCIRLMPLPSEIKVWYFIYTFEGRKRYMPLGNYPEVSIEDAREKYGDAWKLLKNGIDPLTKVLQEKDERRKAPTIEFLASEYLEKHAKKQKKSWKEDERILNKDVLPTWGKTKAVDIKKRDVVLLLEKVSNRAAPVMANRLYALVKKMFNFAIEDDLLEESPCATVKRPNKETSKEHALSEEEIKTLWVNLNKPDIIMSQDIKNSLKLILVTGQRPGEVIGMHSKEIKDRWWTIPKTRTKNGRTHRVYLTDLALGLIGDIKGRSYIFPSPLNTDIRNKKKKIKIMATVEKKVDTHIGEKAMTCALRRNIKGQAYRHKIKRKAFKELPKDSNRLGIDHFTPHVLRHTAITLMAQAGVIHEHRERVANHSIGSMDDTYNQHEYDKEKQAALETLANIISEIIAPPKRIRYRLNKGKKEILIYPDETKESVIERLNIVDPSKRTFIYKQSD